MPIGEHTAPRTRQLFLQQFENALTTLMPDCLTAATTATVTQPDVQQKTLSLKAQSELADIPQAWRDKVDPVLFLSRVVGAGYSLMDTYRLYDLADKHFFAIGCALPNPAALPTDIMELHVKALMGTALARVRKLFSLLGTPPYVFTRTDLETIQGAFALIQQGMQAALPHESLSWLVYNASICVFQLGHAMLTNRHANIAIDLVRWGIFAVEASLPLMASKYVGWRACFYIAAALCYEDLQADQHGTDLLARFLPKLDTLVLIEQRTGTITPELEATFATIRAKINTVLFKLAVTSGTVRNPKDSRVRPAIESSSLTSDNLRIFIDRQLAKYIGAEPGAQFVAVVEALTDMRDRFFQVEVTALRRTAQPSDDVSLTAPAALPGYNAPGNWSLSVVPALISIGRDIVLRRSQAMPADASLSSLHLARFLQAAAASRQWDTYKAVSSKIQLMDGADPATAKQVKARASVAQTAAALNAADSSPKAPKVKSLGRTKTDDDSSAPGEPPVVVRMVPSESAPLPVLLFSADLMRSMCALAGSEKGGKSYLPTQYTLDESKSSFNIPAQPKGAFPIDMIPLLRTVRSALSLGECAACVSSLNSYRSRRHAAAIRQGPCYRRGVLLMDARQAFLPVFPQQGARACKLCHFLQECTWAEFRWRPGE